MSVDAKNRLQPALLDRLLDDEPEKRVESDGARVMSKTALRQAVLRDLAWLLNATQPLDDAARRHARVAASVLNFGLPPLSGQLASKLDIGDLERSIRDAILRFEPRILPDTLRVSAREASSVLDTHNVVEFDITGHLWAQPVPLEMLLRTQLDLEAGQVQIEDMMAVAPARAR
jgi:type VI secretion system protein ImpF